jgi:hypothetical protein
MSQSSETVISIPRPTLTLSGYRAYVFQLILISAAVVLPIVAHSLSAPVRYILPMHWPVILAGLVYGWRGGALTGFFAPVVSYIISGYPLPHIIPSMTVELLAYGMVAGLLREHYHYNAVASTAIALVVGRIIFILSIFILNPIGTSYMQYFQVALLPGLIAAVFQIALLPFVSRWWVNKELQ